MRSSRGRSCHHGRRAKKCVGIATDVVEDGRTRSSAQILPKDQDHPFMIVGLSESAQDASRVSSSQLTQPAILGSVYFLSRFDSLKAQHHYKMAEKSIYAITKFSKSIIGSQASTQSNELDWQHYAQPVLRILLECQRSPQGAPVSARLRIVWTVDRLGSHGRATQENIILVCLLSL